MQKYISIEDGLMGFKIEGIHEITEADKPISEEIYNQFFEMQGSGKSYGLKDINGSTFEEIFEEMELEYVEPQPSQLDILQEENKQLKAENEEIKEVLDNILMNLI